MPSELFRRAWLVPRLRVEGREHVEAPLAEAAAPARHARAITTLVHPCREAPAERIAAALGRRPRARTLAPVGAAAEALEALVD